jgi:hypothetical protein
MNIKQRTLLKNILVITNVVHNIIRVYYVVKPWHNIAVNKKILYYYYYMIMLLTT